MKSKITIFMKRFADTLTQILYTSDEGIEIVETFDMPYNATESDAEKHAEDKIKILELCDKDFLSMYSKGEISIEECVSGIKNIPPKSEIEVLQDTITTLIEEKEELKNQIDIINKIG